ncbi:MAG TPA: hypothetical protein VMU54_15295 [Planctomycetota bacterium]|nr:hypothetical protein [Planctomycetota bacterium]
MMKTMLAATLLLLAAPAQDTHAPDAEGFIRNWLILAPIPVEEGSASTELDKDQVKDEANLKPKAGDKVKIDGKELAWTAHQTADFFIDFLQSFGKERGEDVAAYAVAYVLAEEDMKVKLSVGSNDECKVYVNGKQVIKFAETRTLEKDADTGETTLHKGQNVLVFKVLNEKNNWQGCARFMKDGGAVKNIKISLTPQ